MDDFLHLIRNESLNELSDGNMSDKIHNSDFSLNCKDILGNLSQSNMREEALSDIKPMNNANERIHKWPMQRQDSTALDIELDNSVETFQKFLDQEKNKEKNAKELHAGYTQDKGNINHLRLKQKQKNCQSNCNYEQAGHKQPLRYKVPCSRMSFPALINGQISEEGQPLSFSQVTADYNILHSNTEQTSSKQCHGNTHSFVSSEHIGIHTKPSKSNAKIYFFEDAMHTDNKDKECQIPSKGVESCVEQGGKTWILASIFRKENVMLVMSVALLVLATVVVNLHARVDAIERNSYMSRAKECQCQKEAEMISKNSDSAIESPTSVNNDINARLRPNIDNDVQDTLEDGNEMSNVVTDFFYNKNNDDHRDNLSPRNNQERQLEDTDDNRQHSLLDRSGKDIPRFLNSTNLSINRNGSVERSTNQSNVNDKYEANENRPEMNQNKDNVYTNAEGKIWEFEEDMLGTVKELHSRKIRSERTKVKDPKYVQQKRHKKEPKGNKGGSNSKSQAESFEAQFYQTIHYQKLFMDTGTSNLPGEESNCAPYDNWQRNIMVCKDETVILHHQHTVLPFYLPTNETAAKNASKRMIMTDDKKHGEFHVKVAGDYLVQLNIVIVVEEPENIEKHFLALYVNGQAMFACPYGGFRCPDMNHPLSKKYRVCNIIGLLELKKDDIMDIRTMAPKMTVRVNKKRKSYFRVVLVNKIK